MTADPDNQDPDNQGTKYSHVLGTGAQQAAASPETKPRSRETSKERLDLEKWI